MRSVAHKCWGADKFILMNLYKTLIRSKIDYGSIVYNSTRKKLLQQLDTIHNSAIRIALGAFYTRPRESLYCEASEQPLSLRREYLSSCCF